MRTLREKMSNNTFTDNVKNTTTIKGVDVIVKNDNTIFLVVDDRNFNVYKKMILTSKVRSGNVTSLDMRTKLDGIIFDLMFLITVIVGDRSVDNRNNDHFRMIRKMVKSTL